MGMLFVFVDGENCVPRGFGELLLEWGLGDRML